MAETLGSLCDKLTIVKLKEYHTTDEARGKNLAEQADRLQLEIDEFVHRAIQGLIPNDRLTFSSNKVYKQEGNETRDIRGAIGEVFAELAKVNCELWHEQEKVYEFEKVVSHEKDAVVKRLAILNLERNKCIDAIDRQLQNAIASKK
jgi:hypothetical protein